MTAVAAGALPDGTPVIIAGGSDGTVTSGFDGTVRVWRMADGTPIGELGAHDDHVYAVAAGVLPGGTPVIIGGGGDGTLQAWRMADRTPVGEPLYLSESIQAVTVHGNLIVTAAGADIAVHQLALPAQPLAAVQFPKHGSAVETTG